jgi:hypothetical protein
MNDNKYGSAPVYSQMFFFSKEAEDNFNNAEPAVKKAAMALLEMTCKKSMYDLTMDYIAKSLEEIHQRLEKLENKKEV